VKGDQAVKDSVVSFLARMRSAPLRLKSQRGELHRVKPGGRRHRACALWYRQQPYLGGGAVAFGASRVYNLRVNRKVERLALKRASANA